MRIGVLMGGLSSERELSLKIGEAVAAELRARGHQVAPIFVDRDLDLALRAERLDVAFLALRGRYGEDGCVQGLLELFGIPYTGSSVMASALAADKLKTKELFRQHNLPTPPYCLYARGTAVEAAAMVGLPAVVKPRAGGSGLGVARADDLDELEAAVEGALRLDDHVLVERCVDGREVHVAVLAGRALGAVEIVGPGGLDYAARVGAQPVSLFVPPRLSPERLRGVLALAERAARALETSGLVEVDVVVSDRGNEWLLELDTLPSLLPHATAVRVAQAAGLSFGDLIETLVADARLHAPNRMLPRRSVEAAPFERRAPSEQH